MSNHIIRRKRILLIVVVLLAFVDLNLPRPVYGSATILGVSHQFQQKDLWCWAASASMVLNFIKPYGAGMSQCEVVKMALEDQSSCPNVTGTVWDVQYVFYQRGLRSCLRISLMS